MGGPQPVGRYRDGMRRTVLGAVPLLLSLAFSGCGGGGDGAAERADRVCPLMQRLHDSAEIVAAVDVGDPDQFLPALDDAVAEYVMTLEGLAEVAPAELRDDLTTLRAAVEQLRFDDALAARAPLDEYAGRHCSEQGADQPAGSR